MSRCFFTKASRDQNKNNEIRVLGAGGIARRRMLPAFAGHAAVEVVAAMDVNEAAEIAEEFLIPRHYAEAGALVADPGVEAVYIASSVHLHLSHIRLAAGAGKPAFCEKPVASTLAETLEDRVLCDKKQIPFMEGYMMSFHGAHSKMQWIIAAGEIG